MKDLLVVLFFSIFTISACSQPKADKIHKHNHEVVSINEYLKNQEKDYSNLSVATFAGGCFWCTEAAFDRINGVVDVISGYSGGHKDHPTYYEVGDGDTGHTEAIQVFFDAKVVSFETLLQVLFVAHDPTQVDRQGPDVGPEYRSAIYYHNDAQKAAIENFFRLIKEAGTLGAPIATEVGPYKEFWVAEDYHQDYYEYHPENPYVQRISKPKVEKVKKVFKDILKPEYQKK